MGLRSLFAPDGVWFTDSVFGTIEGTEAIARFIEHTLPPRLFGPGFARHRMESAADMDDLVVLTADGTGCRFQLDLAASKDGSMSDMTIRRLSRTVC